MAIEPWQNSKTQYIYNTSQSWGHMRSTKDETLSIRTSAEIKQLVRQAAEREHRSIASMIEVLVLSYAQQHGLSSNVQTKPTRTQKKA